MPGSALLFSDFLLAFFFFTSSSPSDFSPLDFSPTCQSEHQKTRGNTDFDKQSGFLPTESFWRALPSLQINRRHPCLQPLRESCSRDSRCPNRVQGRLRPQFRPLPFQRADATALHCSQCSNSNTYQFFCPEPCSTPGRKETDCEAGQHITAVPKSSVDSHYKSATAHNINCAFYLLAARRASARRMRNPCQRKTAVVCDPHSFPEH